MMGFHLCISTIIIGFKQIMSHMDPNGAWSAYMLGVWGCHTEAPNHVMHNLSRISPDNSVGLDTIHIILIDVIFFYNLKSEESVTVWKIYISKAKFHVFYNLLLALFYSRPYEPITVYSQTLYKLYTVFWPSFNLLFFYFVFMCIHCIIKCILFQS